MIASGYGICFLFSALIAIYTAQKGYEHIDSLFWTILILVPIVTFGYWLATQVSSFDATVALYYYIDVSSTILMASLLFALLRDIGVNVTSWIKIVVYGLAFAQLLFIWFLVQDGLADSMVRFATTDHKVTSGTYEGSGWFVQYAHLLSLTTVIVGTISLLRAKKRNYSRRTLVMYVALAGVATVLHTAELLLGMGSSLLPYFYVATALAITTSYDHVHAHNISSLMAEQKELHATKGYVAIGLDGRFLSCSEKSFEFLPELKAQLVDTPLPENGTTGTLLYGLVSDFRDKGVTSTTYRFQDMTCECSISYFSLRRDRAAQGYLIDIRDATKEQRALDILSDYNTTLNQEVAEKTEHIEQIQRKIVLGMANMIENRDSNTGGHVKRTSDVIQILVEEIQAHGFIELDDTLARDIVRAAPMHDLGKISIESSVLNKPGQLTDEEFEIMKTHSATSGEMVMILLDGVEEEHFVKTAFNVARYHHERWDGKGYPDGLVGEMIPLEARIMAVADVYDALMSKRVYKESFGFERANQIMYDGMGTQFDPNMRLVFASCQEKLEEYYSALRRGNLLARRQSTSATHPSA